MLNKSVHLHSMYLVSYSLTLFRISWLEYVVLRVCYSSITNACNQFRSKCFSALELKSIHFFVVNSLKELQIPCNKIILWPVRWKMTHVIKDSFRFISFLLSKFSKIIMLLFGVCTRFSMVFHKSANEMVHRLTYHFLLSDKLYLELRFLVDSIKLTKIEKRFVFRLR